MSNIAYFGEPVYSYSLKQGIRAGFLAPCKVVKVHIDRDVEGYRPERGILAEALLRCRRGWSRFAAEAGGSSMHAVIAVPQIAEQHRIVAKVDELMTLCDSLEASLTIGDDARRRLLDALVNEALESDTKIEHAA